MEIRWLTESFAVSPQIAPGHAPAIAEAGFRTVICNRPDNEVSADLAKAEVRIAIEAAGMAWEENVFAGNAMTLEHVLRQRDLADTGPGPVFAYCRTGTRSATAWAFGQAGRMPVDEILAATARGGHGFDGLRPQIEMLARQLG